MKKKIISLILCICLISSFCIQPAYAFGAEGAIIGGGAAAAGVSLTMPQVALLVAAGFGLVYATQHAEEIYRGLDTALTNAANNIEGGIEQLTTWTAQAAQGDIAIASAPTWIVDSIKEWINGLYESKDVVVTPLGCTSFAANETIPGTNFWSDQVFTYPVEVTALRCGYVKESGERYNILNCMLTIVPCMLSDYNTKSVVIDGTTYYYLWSTSGLSPLINGTHSEFDQGAIDLVPLLPNYDYIKNNYTGSTIQEQIIRAWKDGYLDNFGIGADAICPDTTVGGIEGALDVGGIDNINVPDLDIGGSGLLAPDQVGTGSIDDVLNDILTRLKQQELSWSDYMSDVAVGTPSITIEGKDYAIDDTGVTDIPVEDVLPDNPPADGVVVPEGLEPFTIALTDFFPFCIPFDIAAFVDILCADPEAPRFEWEFQWYGGKTDTLTIDLSPFDQVAQLLRNMELLLFCIGLALITREQIRG